MADLVPKEMETEKLRIKIMDCTIKFIWNGRRGRGPCIPGAVFPAPTPRRGLVTDWEGGRPHQGPGDGRAQQVL